MEKGETTEEEREEESRTRRGEERRGKMQLSRRGVLVHLEDEGSGEGENTSEETSSLEGGRSVCGS